MDNFEMLSRKESYIYMMVFPGRSESAEKCDYRTLNLNEGS
jgi:hypothetical protein